MKIIAITDIHGRQNFDKNIAKVISDADLVLIAGDITDFGAEKEASIILDNIKNSNNKILAIPGNCDRNGVNSVLTSLEYNLHGKIKTVGNIAFYGLGGCSKTPFHTPQEYSESDMEKILRTFEKKEDTRFHILVSHSPPAKTKVDKTFMGLHVGSKAIRNFIEIFQPDLVICGHIHEARGIDKIHKTLIINPGPFPNHYAVIHIKDKINYELR